MTTQPKPAIEEIAAFARRHGLDNLTPEHVARMAELAIYVGDLGRTLPRPPAKDDKPAPTFQLSPIHQR